jgi:hypothetical protein
MQWQDQLLLLLGCAVVAAKGSVLVEQLEEQH